MDSRRVSRSRSGQPITSDLHLHNPCIYRGWWGSVLYSRHLWSIVGLLRFSMGYPVKGILCCRFLSKVLKWGVYSLILDPWRSSPRAPLAWHPAQTMQTK